MSRKRKPPMTTPSDPPRGTEDFVTKRRLQVDESANKLTVTEEDETIVHFGDEDLDRASDALNPQQRGMLRQLLRLQRSLGGPQTMLETAGHFNRPPFPPPPRRSR